MRVLFATLGFPLYSQASMENHVRALAALGTDVCVVASAAGDHTLEAPGPGAGSVSVVDAPWSDPRRKKALTLLSTMKSATIHNPRQLGELLGAVGRRHGLSRELLGRLYVLTPMLSRPADVLHLGWVSVATDWIDLLPDLDVPVVVSCHGSDLRLYRLLGDRYLEPLRAVFERADLVHCVSDELASQAVSLGLERSKAFVGTWGVDTTFFRPAREHDGRALRPWSDGQPLRVVSVGRLHWVKGYEFALQALAQVRRAGVEIEYTVIGSGEARLSVLAAVQDLGLDGRVVLRGDLPPRDVRDTLRAADVFLLPSVSEGLNSAALEAMAVGLPVVVTDVGGMREAVTDGVEGFVVPSRDPAALARALLDLAAAPELREKFGGLGRERVMDEFDSTSRAEAMLDQYRQLVRDHPRSRVTTGTN